MNFIRKECIKNFNYLYSHKDMYMDDYTLTILTMVFKFTYYKEVIIFCYNNCFEKEFHEIDYIVDKLVTTDEYNKPILQIKYNIHDNTLFLTQASQELKCFKNKHFEEIFYTDLKKELRNLFLKSLKTSKMMNFNTAL